jgi:hypothetical protein
MSNDQTTRGWLTNLGYEERRLVQLLGWDHPEVLEAQKRFRNAFQSVKSIRNSYEAPSSQENKS